MLYELKLLKLFVATFRWSAAHPIPGVKQPSKQPAWGRGTHWAPKGICVLCPRVPPAEGPVWKCLSLRKCYLLSGGNITATHVIFFLLFICFPQEVAKSGRHEFTWRRRCKNCSCLAWYRVEKRGCQSSLASSCSQIPRAEDRLVNGCPVEGKSNFHPQVSHRMGPVGSLLLNTKSFCDLLSGRTRSSKRSSLCAPTRVSVRYIHFQGMSLTTGKKRAMCVLPLRVVLWLGQVHGCSPDLQRLRNCSSKNCISGFSSEVACPSQ